MYTQAVGTGSTRAEIYRWKRCFRVILNFPKRNRRQTRLRDKPLMRLPLISTVIIASIVLAGFAVGQIQPSGFHIAIIDGEGALNNVKGRIAREPIVQVEDTNHKRVVGAYVSFDTPASGPSGVFADGSTHFVTTTDADGRAVAQGLKPNNITGKFEIHVHVTYQGQPIGDVTIHETNVSGEVAQLSKNVDRSATAAIIAAGVLGVVVGSEFKVDGNSIPGNANLTNGEHLQSLDSPVNVFLHDQCEFVLAPHSSVTVQPNQIDLNTGTLRARHFGNCKVIYGAFQVVGVHGNADGVAVVAADGDLQVASIDGAVRVLTAEGSLVGTVQSGLASNFPALPPGASGASAAIPAGTHSLVPYVLLLGAAATGLGVAGSAIAQSSPTPTSP
jgi:hypothetical protein